MSTTTASNDLTTLSDAISRIGLYVEELSTRSKFRQNTIGAADAIEHFSIAVQAVRHKVSDPDHAEAWRGIAMRRISVALRHYASQELHEALLDAYVMLATFEVGVEA